MYMDILIFILAIFGIGMILYGGGAAASGIFKDEMSTDEFMEMWRKEMKSREESKKKYMEQRFGKPIIAK